MYMYVNMKASQRKGTLTSKKTIPAAADAFVSHVSRLAAINSRTPKRPAGKTKKKGVYHEKVNYHKSAENFRP